MPARKPDTVLSWPVARQLATRAECDPRTIQRAARGELQPGDIGRRARAVVTEYFDDHPEERPANWRRPPELPLPIKDAERLAAEAGVDATVIQHIAQGFSAQSVRAYEVVLAYMTALPEMQPAAAGGG